MSRRVLFFALFLAFSFGQLSKFPLNIPGVGVYLHDLIIVLILLLWLGDHLWQKKKIILPPFAKPIFAFAGTAFLSFLINAPRHQPREVFIASLYLFRWLAYAGLYFVVFENQALQSLIIPGLLGAGFASALIGLLQYFLLPDTRFLASSGWDDHYYRLIAPFLDPGFTGMISVLTLILIVSRYWQKLKAKKFGIGHLSFVICYLALALTYSRSSYLAYLAGMAIIAWKKKAPRFALAVLTLFLITLFLLPQPGGEGVNLGRKFSIDARIQNWQNALKIAKDHPLFGVGFNFYRYVQRDYGFLGQDWQTSHSGAGSDSSLLFVLTTTGLVGLVFYLWLLGKMFQILPATTFSLLVHSFFNNSLFYPWIMLWMWLILASLPDRV